MSSEEAHISSGSCLLLPLVLVRAASIHGDAGSGGRHALCGQHRCCALRAAAGGSGASSSGGGSSCLLLRPAPRARLLRACGAPLRLVPLHCRPHAGALPAAAEAGEGARRGPKARVRAQHVRGGAAGARGPEPAGAVHGGGEERVGRRARSGAEVDEGDLRRVAQQHRHRGAPACPPARTWTGMC